jgi:ribosomal protein S18 acetylase RimI-like enzyme
MMPAVKSFVRPDGRRFVRDPDAESLTRIPGDVHCTVEEDGIAPYLALGFTVHRREGIYLVPTRSAGVETPTGIRLVQADQVDEGSLRLLDDSLRQDVPGTDGWQWDEAGFRDETFESPAFDPATYLVAVDETSRELVGIARVWMRPDRPRLGFVGVLRPYRRRGLARALLAQVFSELDRRGVHEVSTEIDETNTASRALLEGLGAERTGTALELIRHG